jgi:hypothetical protein
VRFVWQRIIAAVQDISKKNQTMPCFPPSISPLPPQLKKRSHPRSLVHISRLPPQAHSGMGNVAASGGVQVRRRPPAVDERLTRPRRLVRELPDLDAGRLRRLIRTGDLAPCFDPAEDASAGLTEECPICFFVCSVTRSR